MTTLPRIPVICLPLRRALRLGQQRRLKEQAAIEAIRAREAKPQAVKRAKTAQGPKSGLTWLEDLGRGPPAIRGRGIFVDMYFLPKSCKWNMDPSNVTFLSFRAMFHFHDRGERVFPRQL
eukprot:symbB.v1.2.034500.t1/scaffold4452.1/size39499/1